MGKLPFKFKFELIVETVDKLATSGAVVFVLERSSKSEATKPVKIDKITRKASFENESLTMEITLFKIQPTSGRSVDDDKKLAEENKILQSRAMELRTEFEREPVHVDILRELRETKMALAFLHFEKENASLQLMKYQRGELKIRRKSMCK